MKGYRIKFMLLFLIVLDTGCGPENKKDETIGQGEALFAKGDQITSNHFTGNVWLKMMGATDTALHVSFGNVTFEPKARTNWHSHPGGQLLFITAGKGYYQARGKPARLLRKGDFVEISANIVHWHGAASDSGFSHIAVSLCTDKGGAVWLGPVTEDEYNLVN